MSSKLRVVDGRDELTALHVAYQSVRNGNWPAENKDNDRLLVCLKNSGETRASIDWKERPGE